MASRSINDMHPRLRELFHAFDERMEQLRIDYIITCTHRPNVEQLALYEIGRTKPGRKVTNATPGNSAHNVESKGGLPAACAFDIAILDKGKCVWDAADIRWMQAGQIGRDVGLKWGGDFHSFPESPHFELPDWRQYLPTFGATKK